MLSLGFENRTSFFPFIHFRKKEPIGGTQEKRISTLVPKSIQGERKAISPSVKIIKAQTRHSEIFVLPSLQKVDLAKCTTTPCWQLQSWKGMHHVEMRVPSLVFALNLAAVSESTETPNITQKQPVISMAPVLRFPYRFQTS